MATVKISALTATTTPASADVFPLVQGGTTKQATIGNLFRNLPAGTAAAPGLSPTGDQDTGVFSGGADIFGFATGGTERARINAAGYFKIGNAGSYIGATGSYHEISGSAADAALYLRNTHASTPYGISANFTGASPDNNTQYFFVGADATTNRVLIYSDGDLQNHDNSYGAISDERLKQSIVDADLDSQYADIRATRLRKYKLKSDVDAYGDEAVTQIGVIAQELMEVSPGLVKVGEDGFFGVEYSVLQLKHLGATQKLMGMVEDLTARVEALEAA
jgi:hypothetical protein